MYRDPETFEFVDVHAHLDRTLGSRLNQQPVLYLELPVNMTVRVLCT